MAQVDLFGNIRIGVIIELRYKHRNIDKHCVLVIKISTDHAVPFVVLQDKDNYCFVTAVRRLLHKIGLPSSYDDFLKHFQQNGSYKVIIPDSNTVFFVGKYSEGLSRSELNHGMQSVSHNNFLGVDFIDCGLNQIEGKRLIITRLTAELIHLRNINQIYCIF